MSRSGSRRPHVEASRIAAAASRFAPRLRSRKPLLAEIQRVEEEVLLDGHRPGERLLGALAGRKAEAGGDGIGGRADPRRRAADQDRCRRRSGMTPASARPTASWPAPRSPASPTISPARPSNETGPTCPRSQTLSPRAPAAARRLRRRRRARRHAADDVGDELVRREVVKRPVDRDRAAVAKHGHGVGDAEDLVEPMRDVDDADVAGACSRSQDAEQPADIGLRQAGGRLVEDQQLDIAVSARAMATIDFSARAELRRRGGRAASGEPRQSSAFAGRSPRPPASR